MEQEITVKPKLVSREEVSADIETTQITQEMVDTMVKELRGTYTIILADSGESQTMVLSRSGNELTKMLGQKYQY